MTLEANIIVLVPLTGGTSTVQEGYALYNKLEQPFRDKNTVKLSLHNTSAISSSFLHASIGRLIEVFGVSAVVNQLRLTNYKPSQAELIKSYIADYRATA